MKISVNDICVYELTPEQEMVIKYYILEHEFEEDMQRRVRIAIEDKYQRCFQRLKEEWDPKLEGYGITHIPTNRDEYIKMLVTIPEFKLRSERDREQFGN